MMGLFTPAWKNKDAEKRAAAFARMDDGKLLKIVFDRENDESLRREAATHLKDFASAEAILLDRSMPFSVIEAAVNTIKSQSALCDVLRDHRMSGGVQLAVLPKIMDESVLSEYIVQLDEGSWEERQAALNGMHNKSLIVDTAIRRNDTDTTYYAIRRLTDMHDGFTKIHNDKELLRLACSVPEIREYAVEMVIRYYRGDTAVLETLFRNSRCERLRWEALSELAKTGQLSPQIQTKVYEALHECIPRCTDRDATKSEDVNLVLSLLSCLPADAPLTDEVRSLLYGWLPITGTHACRVDWQWCKQKAVQFLAAHGDPVGLALLPFYEKLLTWGYMADADYAPLLTIPADMALDFLLAFRETRGKMEGWPHGIQNSCAKAICLLHKNTSARERIERELPPTKSFDIEYQYQDDENDIHDDRDVFTVTYWEKE